MHKLKKFLFIGLSLLTLTACTQRTNPQQVEIQQSALEASGQYQEYQDSLLSKAETGRVVLDFRADWCPTCLAFEDNLRENFEELPEDVTILTLDYDTEIDLRRKYGVTMQHTFVQVDSNGEEIKRWNTSLNVESFVSELES